MTAFRATPSLAALRILHVLDHSVPLQSGYAFRTQSILREQRRLGWETVQVTTVRQGARAAEEAMDGFLFHRTAPPGPLFCTLPGLREIAEMAGTAARLREVAEAFKPDLIHAHSPVLAAIPSLWVARWVGIPFVYEVRAFWEDAAVDHGSISADSLRYRLTRLIETLILKRADAVVTICQGLQQDILSRGIPPERLTVVPNGVDPAVFRPASDGAAALIHRLGLDGRIVLGFIGSLYAYEGLDLLLEAISTMGSAADNLALLVIGDGPKEAGWQALAGRLGLGARVSFLGRIPHDQVREYYQAIDICVYPRRSIRLTELVTPLKPLEAMAMGRVVIASDVGGHRELIRHGHTGFLFAPGDPAALAAAVAAAVAASDRWPEFATAARGAVVEERTWARCAARYHDAYAGALARRRRPAALSQT